MSRYTQWRPTKWYLWDCVNQRELTSAGRFTSKARAQAHKVSLTKGRRDVLSNRFRSTVFPATDELRAANPQFFKKP